VRETFYGPPSTTLGRVHNTNQSSYSRHKISTSLAATLDCSIEWRPFIQATTHTHTHIDNIRQSEPQLKECSCSSAIPSHNSKDAISSHNSRKATCLPTIPSHNSSDIVLSHDSRNTLASRSLRYHRKPCRPNTTKACKHYALALSLGAALELPGEIQLQTAWRKLHVAKHHVPLEFLSLLPSGQTPLPGTMRSQCSCPLVYCLAGVTPSLGAAPVQ